MRIAIPATIKIVLYDIFADATIPIRNGSRNWLRQMENFVNRLATDGFVYIDFHAGRAYAGIKERVCDSADTANAYPIAMDVELAIPKKYAT